ncbi:MAG: thioredoxin domain-containing protein, partial [Candidatus Zixiibacteriota bacterium]
ITVFNPIACGEQKDEGMELDNHNEHLYTNHLINETSPYLLQHAHNPVDWYSWGDEALEKAKKEDKPIFLSIGYSACHWCHVMERESFENVEIATILNKYFISIKVDREQRPDLDQIYMSFTTALTGRGGWPMSVFLTPDLKPFYAGTYFPPYSKYGRPGFLDIISEIGNTFKKNKESIINSSEDIYAKVVSRLQSSSSISLISKSMVKHTAEALMKTFDNTYGGFGQAPKFPHALELSLFLRVHKATGDVTYLNAAKKALKGMAQGGIYDHLGGGFARYSTDRKWLVPHFEKMLYDNSLLVPTYIEAYKITGESMFLDVVRGTLDFMLNEMTDKTGGFYSALDADSEGEEGKFYIWSKKEIDAVLGEKAETFNAIFNVTEKGNFENKNILHLTDISTSIKNEATVYNFNKIIQESKNKLLHVRSERVRPLTDDKILTSWNGLALSAFCKGYQITKDQRYLDAAMNNASFVLNNLYRNKKLTHAYRQGKHSNGQFLEDYAFYVRGLLDLYETDNSSYNYKWFEFAVELTDNAIDMFIDEAGHFYLRPDNQSDLIYRPKNETDGAIPAAGSFMIANLLKINRITENKKYLQTAQKALTALSGQINSYPNGMVSAVCAVDYYLNDKIEIVIVGQGKDRDKMLDVLYHQFLPNKIIAISSNGQESLPLFEGRQAANNKVMAYVCRNSVCNLPVSTAEELKRQLDDI